MDVYTSISTRKSVRAFRDREVPDNVISRLLEAARLAPSASNRQEWRFVVVRNPEMRKRLARVASGQKFVGEAPVVIACCAETDGHVMACGQPCYPIDVAIAIDHPPFAHRPKGWARAGLVRSTRDKSKRSSAFHHRFVLWHCCL